MAVDKSRKYVVSASRRTDLLASNPNHLLAALNGQLSITKGLRPEKIHTLLISTKDFRPLLDNLELRSLVKRCDQVCMNLTITGLGGTRIEPNVPDHDILLDRLGELVEFVGDPRRILWCFSPILSYQEFSNFSMDIFAPIATSFAKEGISKAVLTFHIPYESSAILPDQIDREEQVMFAQQVDTLTQSLKMQMSICKMKNYHRLRCVDMKTYSELHPDKDDSVVEYYQKMKKPRGHCRDAIWDIGWYMPRCKHACLYCYGLAEKIK